jgi:hypothetical protein
LPGCLSVFQHFGPYDAQRRMSGLGVLEQSHEPDIHVQLLMAVEQSKARIAAHLYWMWRQGWDYGQFEKLGSHAGEPGNRHGVQ